MSIAEHDPSKLYGRNSGMLQMSKAQLHDYAATPRTGLPKKVKPPKVRGALVSIASLMKKRSAVQKPTMVGGSAA